MPAVTNYSHDRAPGSVFRALTNAQAFTDRIFIWPILPRHRFVDDDHGLGGFDVSRIQAAAAFDWYFQSREVVGTNYLKIHRDVFIRLRNRTSLHAEAAVH